MKHLCVFVCVVKNPDKKIHALTSELAPHGNTTDGDRSPRYHRYRFMPPTDRADISQLKQISRSRYQDNTGNAKVLRLNNINTNIASLQARRGEAGKGRLCPAG